MKSVLGSLFLVASFGLGSIHAQRVQKCDVSAAAGRYKVIFATRPNSVGSEVLLDVVISPKNFNRSFMNDFVRRIRATFCKEDTISISLFDSEKAAKGWHYIYMISKGQTDSRRGTYMFNRRSGKEALEFSTKPGNPIDEVKMELSEGNSGND
jgi:hypothetical protein